MLNACSDQIKQHKSFRLVFNGMKEICLGNLKVKLSTIKYVSILENIMSNFEEISG